MSLLDIRMLGELRVHYAGRVLDFSASPRLQAFFAYLALHRGITVSRAQLAYLFWPDSSDAQARANLRRLILYLRRLLPEAERFVKLDGQTLLWLENPEVSLDVADFEQAALAAQELERAEDRLAVLEEAERLYTGDLLPGLYDDWLETEREALKQRFTWVLSQLLALREQRGEQQLALQHAQRLTQLEPLTEGHHRKLMALYSEVGERGKALHAYHRCVTLLQEDLGVEPEPETQALMTALLQGASAVSRVPLERPQERGDPPLLGRASELVALEAAWRRALAGHASLALISGESGIGKTRLAEAFIPRVRAEAQVAFTRCHTAEGSLAYAPITDLLRSEALQGPRLALADLWLGELVRLLPELERDRPDLPPPSPLSEAWQRQRFFEALARAVLVAQPLLVVMDDLQWCDRDSLQWLHYFFRFAPEAQVLVMATCRADELPPAHPLVSLLFVLERDDKLLRLELGALDEASAGALAQALSDPSLAPDTLAGLYEETEGHPLFIVEMVREGQFRRRDGPSPLPPRLRSVIASRLLALSPQARELAGVAALIGRTFALELLAKASQQEESHLVGHLDELWRRRIIRERDAHAYDFSHDKLREVAVAELGPIKKRFHHQAIAEALENSGVARGICGQLAFHYEQAARPEKALPYYLQAAGEAQQLYANLEARTLYEKALALGEALPQTPENTRWMASACEGMADIHKLHKAHEPAREFYARALTLLPAADAVKKARLTRKLGTSLIAQYRYDEALTHYEEAEGFLRALPSKDTAWWQEWLELSLSRCRTLYWLNRWQEMQVLAKGMEEALKRYGDALQRSKFHQSLNLMLLRRDRYRVGEEALSHARAAYEVACAAGNVREMAVTRFGLGFSLLWRGEFQEATRLMAEALELAEKTGDRVLAVRSLTYLSVAQRQLGKADKVLELALELQAKAREAEMPAYLGVAKANFAWLAWLEGDPPRAEAEARAALELWQTGPGYMFKWVALFPLIAALMHRRELTEALASAAALLEPEQQALPNPLPDTLERAIAAGASKPEVAEAQLSRALELARAHRFL